MTRMGFIVTSTITNQAFNCACTINIATTNCTSYIEFVRFDCSFLFTKMDSAVKAFSPVSMAERLASISVSKELTSIFFLWISLYRSFQECVAHFRSIWIELFESLYHFLNETPAPLRRWLIYERSIFYGE